MTTYQERCGNLSIEQKRKDLLINPFINHEQIKLASDEEVNQVHELIFTTLDNSMLDIISESMFDDDW